MIPDTFDPAYLVTLDEIYHCRWVARKKARIELLRRAIEHFWPEGHPTHLVHLSGTNGKGSVAHYLEQGLRFAGTTGSWTGPHVFDYAERIHLDAELASHTEIADVYSSTIEPYQRSLGDREPLGFPELGILLTLCLFERHGVVWGMMESGVGGRYTPLMAITASACVLTNVGGDHPLSLGQKLWQRALEKAGMARPKVPFFTAATGEALGYVAKTAEAQEAPVQVIGESDVTAVREGVLALDGERRLPETELANLALAVRLICHFYPERDTGELLSMMPGRLPARFFSPEPGVIVDVAHNRDKIEHFVARLKLEYPGRRFRFLIGLTRQRDPIDMFEPLFEIAEDVTVTSASYPGRDPKEIAERLATAFGGVSVREDPRQAFLELREHLREGQLLVLTGSAYMIDQALNPDPYVRHLNASFGWRNRIGDQV